MARVRVLISAVLAIIYSLTRCSRKYLHAHACRLLSPRTFRASPTHSLYPSTSHIAYTFTSSPSSLCRESMSHPSFDTPFADCPYGPFVRLVLTLFFLEGSISPSSFGVTFVARQGSPSTSSTFSPGEFVEPPS
ncbi:hypothetical protein EI94DRAFT_815503 [Lactarius quietus]|nr:hypothetical protein EI94DRAFT_815503 [Lactarius quietus]